MLHILLRIAISILDNLEPTPKSYSSNSKETSCFSFVTPTITMYCILHSIYYFQFLRLLLNDNQHNCHCSLYLCQVSTSHILLIHNLFECKFHHLKCSNIFLFLPYAFQLCHLNLNHALKYNLKVLCFHLLVYHLFYHMLYRIRYIVIRVIIEAIIFIHRS